MLKNLANHTAITGLILASFGFAHRSQATTVADLTVDCGGTYEVIASETFYEPALGRRPAQGGVHEKIKVLTIAGPGCNLLATKYGIDLQVGEVISQSLAMSDPTPDFIQNLSLRLGTIQLYKVEQRFPYAASDGALPLFPLAHAEEISVLGQSPNGSADVHVEAVYGIGSVNDLSAADQEKLIYATSSLIAFTNQITFEGSYLLNYDLVSLFLCIEPVSDEGAKQYLWNLASLFQTATQDIYDIYTADLAAYIGARLNNLLSTADSAYKVRTLVQNPLLFDEHVIGWFDKNLPALTTDELDQMITKFSAHAAAAALLQSQNRTYYILSGYKKAAGNLLNPNSRLYPLTQAQITTLEGILAL